MPTASAAPKVGAPSQKPPGTSSVATTKTAAVTKVPGSGTKTNPIAQPPRPAAAPKYLLPEITPSLVVRLFENIPEYKQYKINNLDVLIQGMLHLAQQPINGIGPGGLPVAATPLNNFLAQLVMLAVEKGSKGVGRNG